MLTGAQIRAGRALVRWTTGQLARRAGVGIATVTRAEAHDGVPQTTGRHNAAIGHALSEAGVVFVPGGATLRERGWL